MKHPLGLMMLGMAFASVMAPRWSRLGVTLKVERRPRQLFALVQTKPQIVVLAVSDSEADMLREKQELNDTWNHWRLRTERQRYEVQPVPMWADSGKADSGRRREKVSAIRA